MDDAPKVRLASVETIDGRSILSMRTVENIDVHFELDDMALGVLYLTIPGVMEERLGDSPRAFWRGQG